MQTILFPTDFSSNSIHASQYVGMLAKRLNAKVVLLHGYPIPMPMVAAQQLIFDTEISVVQSEQDAQTNLALFAAKFIEDTHLPTHSITQMVEYGLVSDTIIKVAKSINADFIVMGTKGTTDALDRWVGENAQTIIELAECPVWLVPQNAPIRYPEKIMYAADFQEDEVVATHKILDIAKPLGATCKVIHVNNYVESKAAHGVQKIVNELEEVFEDDDVTFKNLNRTGVIDGLEAYIKIHQPDVLALAMYEKSFLSQIFDTRISHHFVQEANLPMLTFKK